MTFCVSTDVGTWTNWSTLESDPDHSTNAGTGFLSPLHRGILLRWENPYWAPLVAGRVVLNRMHCNAEFITSGKSHVLVLGAVEAVTRGFEHRNTVVGGK